MFYLLLCVSGVLSYDSQGYHYRPPSFDWSLPASNSSLDQTDNGFHPWWTSWAKPNNSIHGHSENAKPESRYEDDTQSEIQNTECQETNESQDTNGHIVTSTTTHNPINGCRNMSTVPSVPTSTSPASTTTRPISRPTYPPPGPTYLPPRPTNPPSTRPPPYQSGPATMSEPVPTLREFYAPSLQYHVGIYTKRFTPYMQICGGSLIKADVAISAAHCFWNDGVGLLRAALFAVAAGKLLRPWEVPRETFAQRSDVKDIKIPSRFQGGRTSFQDDIAVVVMSNAFEYAPGVLPVCVSFDLGLERRQLKSGNLGTIAGWGLTQINGPPSQRLNFVKLPYVDIDECIKTAESSFVKYITSDKICAGDQKIGRALCRGDSGGGLIYYSGDIPYLRGIASTAQRDNNDCNAYSIASFTQVRAHRTFLEDHVPDIAEGCEALYSNETKLETKQSGTTRLAQENTGDLHGYQSSKQLKDKTHAEQKNSELESQKPNTNTLSRQSLNEGSDKEGTLEEKYGQLYILNEKAINTMNRQSIDNKYNVQAEMMNMTFQKMTQNGIMSKEVTKEVTSVTTSRNQRKVMMRLARGEWGVITAPVNGESTFVCDCFCGN